MVCEVENMIIDPDERREIPVVIRFITQFNQWFICHEKSYQNAFSKDVNGFDFRSEAVDFAEDHDCQIILQDFDVLQSYED